MSDAEKKRGRPAVGVTQQNFSDLYLVISNAIEADKLFKDNGWLTECSDPWQAKKEFYRISATGKNRTDELNDWRLKYLTDKAWKRVQANARQSRLVRGCGDKEPKRNIQVGISVAVRLSNYAKRHNMTINDAIKHLLDSVTI